MRTTFLVSLLYLFIITPAFTQDQNVTVPDTDPSVTYTGVGTGDARICKLNANGDLFGGQPGCYLIPSGCAPSVAMSLNTDNNASASFKFRGSSIYINSALDNISPFYTVTLDGRATDIDGVRPSRFFNCAPLFFQNDLDPRVEHIITLSVKGASPNRNMTVDPDGTLGVFSLINFIYTVPAPISNGTGVSGTTLPSSSKSATSTAPNPTSNSNAAPDAGVPSTFARVLALVFGALFSPAVFSIL